MAAWTWLIPALSFALLIGGLVAGVGSLFAIVCAAALIGAVIAAVHYAEVVAHRVGEPFGTLVLAVAVTVIEVSLILSIMLAGGPDAAALPRDTIYAAIMIICNGVVGLCVLVGGLVHREQSFRVEGSSAALAALIALSTFSLVLPVFTTTTPSGTYSNAQLAFAAITSLALWAVYVFIQTVRHRDYFLPPADASSPDAHAKPPTNREAWASFGLTIPVVAVAAIALGMPLILGLGPKELVMLAVTLLLSAVTLGSGRTNMMQGAVHLVVFVAFLFLALVP
jgi:Ca2+:H+ antiporter